MKNEYYDTEEAYLDAVADALQGRVRGDRQGGLPAAARLPRSGAGAAPLLQRPAARRVPRFRRAGRRRDQRARSSTCRATGCGCMCAGATTKARTTATCRSRTSCRSCRRRMSAASCLPFANPRHQHEYRVLEKHPLADDQIIVAGVIDDLTGFRRASRSRRRPLGKRRARRRRPAPGPGRHRLRLRHLGRDGPRHRGRDVGEVPRDGRRRADREPPAGDG